MELLTIAVVVLSVALTVAAIVTSVMLLRYLEAENNKDHAFRLALVRMIAAKTATERYQAVAPLLTPDEEEDLLLRTDAAEARIEREARSAAARAGDAE